MQELTRVRELRADAPAPDRALLAPGRQRLLAAALTDERPRAVWDQRRKVVVALVFVAVSAIAVATTVVVDGGGAERKVTSAVSPTTGPHLEGMTAPELLERAATAVERQRLLVEPRETDSIVTEQYLEFPGVEDSVRERWVKFDEAAYNLGPATPADRREERRIVHDGPEDWQPLSHSPKQVYDFLATLPADGEGTLQALRERNAVPDAAGAGQAERDYAEIAPLLEADAQPMRGLASLYRALATVPGGTVVDHQVEYGYGKRAVALSYPARLDTPNALANATTEWLLDPETYRVVGHRSLVDGEVRSSVSVASRIVVHEEQEQQQRKTD